jgi:hypothetical protein
MEDATYVSRMRYLDADDVIDPVVDYDGLDVYGADDLKIGDVDGFIVDRDAGRVNYVVVDSGGWFTSRRLLLPIGHASLSADRKSLKTDVTRDTLSRLPEFDEDRFRAFTDADLRAFERNTVIACCPDEPLEDVSATTWGYDSWRHYQEPDWWRTSRYAPDRLRELSSRIYRTTDRTGAAPATRLATAPVRETYDADLVTAGERDRAAASNVPAPGLSPADQRAQPGDVLGIESGGEVTHIGDTADDEDARRLAAERAVRRDR